MISHVRWEANSGPHNLAEFALSCSMKQTWMDETPRCVYDIVLLEESALTV
jgi:hypothetical protein